MTRPQIARVLGALLPRLSWTDEDLLAWLMGTERRNDRAKRSHLERRRRREGWLNEPSL